MRRSSRRHPSWRHHVGDTVWGRFLLETEKGDPLFPGAILDHRYGGLRGCELARGGSRIDALVAFLPW